MIRVGIVGDFDASFAPHRATGPALEHAAAARGLQCQWEWVATDSVSSPATLREYHGLLIAPGSPYRSLQGALVAIEYARREGVALLGTCGGFQHVVLEYARNVLGIQDAQHAEYDPYASRLFVVPLSCSLVGQTMRVLLEPGSRAAAAYGRHEVDEQYYCNFGLNPAFENDLDSAGLRIAGRDAAGEVRVVELPSHPFFCGTLFVPQLSSRPDAARALIVSFLAACEGVSLVPA